MTTTPAPNHDQELIVRINNELQVESQKGGHVLAPLTLQTIPPMHRPVLVTVQIDKDPAHGEVYKQRENMLSLSGLAFKKLGDAMGIQWNPDECRRTDDGRDPDYCSYRMCGKVKALDGTWRVILGDKEIRMSVVMEELRETKKRELEKGMADPAQAARIRDKYSNPNEWVDEEVRREALQIKKHMLSRCQTGALCRATKSIGIRETYTAAELTKPFVFPKLVFSPDPNNPQDRAFLLQQGSGAVHQLYPAAPPQPFTPTATVMAGLPPAEETRDVVFFASPESTGNGGAPTKEEVLRADFKEATPKGQAEMLRDLVTQKNWVGKITGEVISWKAEDRMTFLEHLLTLPDRTAAVPTEKLPFE
jgi:hypothetical protein